MNKDDGVVMPVVAGTPLGKAYGHGEPKDEQVERLTEQLRNGELTSDALDKACYQAADLLESQARQIATLTAVEALAVARKDSERLSWLDRDDVGQTMGYDEQGGPFVVVQALPSGKLLAAMSDIRSAIDEAILAASLQPTK